MLDFLFALGQFVCAIGLLYGLILTIVNWKYAGSIECRYDPVIGHDWCRDVPDDSRSLIPGEFITIKAIQVNERPRQNELEPVPLSIALPEHTRDAKKAVV